MAPRWLRRLFRRVSEPVPQVEVVEDKMPCQFGTHFHTAGEVAQEHAANDGGHWSNERTDAFPINRPFTPGQQYRSRGRGGWWRA
jgi:hypothetical protein